MYKTVKQKIQISDTGNRLIQTDLQDLLPRLRCPQPQTSPQQGALCPGGWETCVWPQRQWGVGGTAVRPCSGTAWVWTSRLIQNRCPSPPRTRVCGSAPSPCGWAGSAGSPRSIWRRCPSGGHGTSSCTLCVLSWSPWLLGEKLQKGKKKYTKNIRKQVNLPETETAVAAARPLIGSLTILMHKSKPNQPYFQNLSTYTRIEWT